MENNKEENFTYTECENGHQGKGIGFEDICPECEAPQKILTPPTTNQSEETWKCNHRMHCKCMNLGGQCPNDHYADCIKQHAPKP